MVPVSTFVAVTVHPGTSAPEESVTEPLISAEVACAPARGPINANNNNKKHAAFNTSAHLVLVPARDSWLVRRSLYNAKKKNRNHLMKLNSFLDDKEQKYGIISPKPIQ
jgi:hypothetical protein